MPTPPISKETIAKAIAARRRYGSNIRAAEALGVPRGTFIGWLRAGGIKRDEIEAQGKVQAGRREQWPVPTRGVKRYLFTCAQNDTKLHSRLWANLLALAKHYDARLCVSTFTYDLNSYGENSVKRGKVKHSDPVWDHRIDPYIADENVDIAPGLVWCGEMNIIPTAVRPLSGLESYTGRKSGIFPHVKIALESIASGKFEGTKFNYTTGTVTQRNYIQKKAGQKAEFHHGYGALLVEVDKDGDWFCRQINGDSEGVIYDLDLRVKHGKVSTGQRVEALQWGDIHVGRISKETVAMLWGKGGMLDTLRPRYQFAHDVLDWRARSHHTMKNFHRAYENFVLGKDDVVAELRECAEFLIGPMWRPWCDTVVVRSNHDAHFDRWLREADYKADLKNARFFLAAQLAYLDAMHEGDGKFLPIEWACNRFTGGRISHARKVRFLRQDESFIICHDANGGIECGHHGDKGVNGGRGSIGVYARTGRKTNTGHTHSPCIMDGAYCAGGAGDLDHGYNEGLSSWSNTHIVTYANGKRSLITCWGKKWRAK